MGRAANALFFLPSCFPVSRLQFWGTHVGSKLCYRLPRAGEFPSTQPVPAFPHFLSTPLSVGPLSWTLGRMISFSQPTKALYRILPALSPWPYSLDHSCLPDGLLFP